MEQIKRLRAIARRYYARKDIQKGLVAQATYKEIVPQYFDGFGKRPDTVEYEQDIANLAAKGATSFHCSEELWSNPLELNTSLQQKQVDKLRVGWNLILDIDCKFLEYSKIAAWLLCEALYFHGIRNFGLKFSGGSGFHMGLGFRAFPSSINNIKIKDFFPQGPRLIASYLKDMIAQGLRTRILELSTPKEIAQAIGKPIERLLDEEKRFNPFSILELDTILIAPRHLYRMAYSLHERTALASIVIKPEQIKAFHPAWARPDRVFPVRFMPEPEPDEARELLTQAIDWQAKKEEKKARERKIQGAVPKAKAGIINISQISKSQINEEIFPPCIKAALKGIQHDGRKRTLFILINFFRSLRLDFETIKKKLEKWNKLNYKPLKENYIVTQLQWFKRQESRLPPNCALSAYYQDIGICTPDFLCKKIKNPVNYVMLKAKMTRTTRDSKKGGRKKGGRGKTKVF